MGKLLVVIIWPCAAKMSLSIFFFFFFVLIFFSFFFSFVYDLFLFAIERIGTCIWYGCVCSCVCVHMRNGIATTRIPTIYVLKSSLYRIINNLQYLSSHCHCNGLPNEVNSPSNKQKFSTLRHSYTQTLNRICLSVRWRKIYEWILWMDFWY